MCSRSRHPCDNEQIDACGHVQPRLGHSGHEACQETPIVAHSDAIVEPHAVVVKAPAAALASSAVLGACSDTPLCMAGEVDGELEHHMIMGDAIKGVTLSQ